MSVDRSKLFMKHLTLCIYAVLYGHPYGVLAQQDVHRRHAARGKV